jgi:ATP-dependent DNA ligase
MLATNHKLTDGRWAIEPKLDGWKARVYVDGGVRVRTRRGRDITA